ncbi:hypothetical protein PEP31012_00878 [Pandoraea eparura]|uniref:Uncharacterized protein n=1 Tax=Pandoraea eparura TaxID=2508291 RepID=A0A5E4SLT1_9BURK|nr:hypothetical protein [Pandoraea eparura]VVD76660.1 hypothetical protein PEP31012_00878 [Pandoraea eparura]
MHPLFDQYTEQRQANLRAMQGLPSAVQNSYAAGRKSDFARPRRALHLCLLALAAAIVYLSSLPAVQTDPAPVRKPSIYRAVCDVECQRVARPSDLYGEGAR